MGLGVNVGLGRAVGLGVEAGLGVVTVGRRVGVALIVGLGVDVGSGMNVGVGTIAGVGAGDGVATATSVGVGGGVAVAGGGVGGPAGGGRGVGVGRGAARIAEVSRLLSRPALSCFLTGLMGIEKFVAEVTSPPETTRPMEFTPMTLPWESINGPPAAPESSEALVQMKFPLLDEICPCVIEGWVPAELASRV